METEKIQFQRLHWKSPWLQLGLPFTAMGLWFLIHQLWNGFLLLSTIAGVLLLSIGIPICAACFQAIVINSWEVRLKLGFLTLRRLNVESIRTLAGATVSIGKGGSCCESLIILSPRKGEELADSGAQDKINVYFRRRFIFSFLPPKEGLWLYYSSDRAHRIRECFPHAADKIT